MWSNYSHSVYLVQFMGKETTCARQMFTAPTAYPGRQTNQNRQLELQQQLSRVTMKNTLVKRQKKDKCRYWLKRITFVIYQKKKKVSYLLWRWRRRLLEILITVSDILTWQTISCRIANFIWDFWTSFCTQKLPITKLAIDTLDKCIFNDVTSTGNVTSNVALR